MRYWMICRQAWGSAP
ncbi:hypothetical protein C356_07050 [Cryptococcus neoformans c45]|nr:hypothetical protein C356_07050 [Cryptococcus neoformans var. grubii c45]